MVGLGNTGLSALRSLTTLGVDAIGLESGDIGSGAAGLNAGVLLSGLAIPYHKLRESYPDSAREAYALTLRQLDRMREELPDHVQRFGAARRWCDAEEQRDCEAQHAALSDDGFPAELREDRLQIPTDGSFNPYARAVSLTQRLNARGVRLFARSRVTAIDGDHVTTELGEIECRAVIVAVDALIGRVLPELSERAVVHRLQVLATERSRDLRAVGSVYYQYRAFSWQYLPSGRVVIAGASEPSAEPKLIDVGQAEVERVLREVVGSRAAVSNRWAGLVSRTADGLPICEELRPGLYALGAYNAAGNVIGPMLGQELARRISGKGDSPMFDLIAAMRAQAG